MKLQFKEEARSKKNQHSQASINTGAGLLPVLNAAHPG